MLVASNLEPSRLEHIHDHVEMFNNYVTEAHCYFPTPVFTDQSIWVLGRTQYTSDVESGSRVPCNNRCIRFVS